MNRLPLCFVAVVCGLIAFAASSAPAGLISIVGDPDDVIVRGVGTVGTPQDTLDRIVDVIGAGGSASDGRAAILFFELPTGVTSSAELTAANLKLNLIENVIGSLENTLLQGDLYGLGFQSDTTPDLDWFYNGPLDTDLSEGVGIDDRMFLQDSFVTHSTPLGVVETDATGDANLLAFVKSAYDAGAAAGDFLVLRLNMDRDIDGDHSQGRYRFTWAGGVAPNDVYDEDDVATYGPYIPPVLELTTGAATVPAPAALPAGLALLALAGLRRGRRG